MSTANGPVCCRLLRARAVARAASRSTVRKEIDTDGVFAGLYTDESPGLKVDPVVVLVLSLGFIFSVVALHSESFEFEI